MKIQILLYNMSVNHICLRGFLGERQQSKSYEKMLLLNVISNRHTHINAMNPFTINNEIHQSS